MVRFFISVSPGRSNRLRYPSVTWIVSLLTTLCKDTCRLNNTLTLLKSPRKDGIVQWSSGDFVWFQDESTMVDCMHLPATIKFTKERGYDVRPGDLVSVAHGPKFCTKGVMHSVDFPNAQLTLETHKELDLMRNADLNAFNCFIKKEVFVIGGNKKGFWATLYGLSMDNCVIAVHGQPCMMIKCYNAATTYGCRLNGAMLEWNNFTSFLLPLPLKNHHRQSQIPELPLFERIGPQKFWPHILHNRTVPVLRWKALGPSMPAASRTPLSFTPNHVDYAHQFHGHHTLFNVSAGFQGSRLLKCLVYTQSPDLFCGPHGLAPPGHISAWCTAKMAGGPLNPEKKISSASSWMVSIEEGFKLLRSATPRTAEEKRLLPGGETAECRGQYEPKGQLTRLKLKRERAKKQRLYQELYTANLGKLLNPRRRATRNITESLASGRSVGRRFYDYMHILAELWRLDLRHVINPVDHLGQIYSMFHVESHIKPTIHTNPNVIVHQAQNTRIPSEVPPASLRDPVMLAICKLVYWSPDGRCLLLPIREVTLEVLWNKLPSADPLLHLLPEDIIERHLEKDGKWSYSYIGTRLPSDLEQFYMRAPHIRAIISHEHSLGYDAVDMFKNILDYHTSISDAPFLLCLAHLQLANNSDPLLKFILSLIHMGLETLVLPYCSSLSSSIISHVLQILPPLSNIVYIKFGEEAHDFSHHTSSRACGDASGVLPSPLA
ncbi:hypothetical protein BDR03DRAFT_987713 [Suillus americanus]|nr:hypothetical protein BDR03DRAFT_987713 [Suillus americanus]